MSDSNRDRVSAAETLILVLIGALSLACCSAVLEGPPATDLPSAGMDLAMLMLGGAMAAYVLLFTALAIVRGLKDFHQTMDDITRHLPKDHQ